MIFVFSYLPKEKSLGPAAYKECQSCTQELYFNLIEHHMELQVFFLPLFRHQRTLYQVCPNCGEKEQVLKLDYAYYRSLAQLQKEALDGLPIGEYEARLKELKKP